MIPDFPSIRLRNALLGALTDTSTLNVQVMHARVRDGVPEYDVTVWVSEATLATEGRVVMSTTQAAVDHLGCRVRLTVRTTERSSPMFLLTPQEGP